MSKNHNSIITSYLQNYNPSYKINISIKPPEYKKSIGYKTNTGNKIYQNKIENVIDKIMKSDLVEIHEIYLKLKNSEYENEDMIINELIEEIKKNKYTDVQYFILALLIFRLKNIDKQNFTYNITKRISNKSAEYVSFVFDNKKNFSMNKKINSIIKKISSKNPKKLDIILRFIDEYIEVSKENSELREKITFILSSFVKGSL